MSADGIALIVLGCVFVACLLVLWVTRKRPPTYAEELQKLHDEIEALKVAIGRPLLPPLQAMVHALNDLFKRAP